MKRSTAYWIWLLADVSLDRAATILPLVNFPVGTHSLVQSRIDKTGLDLSAGQEIIEALTREIRIGLYDELGETARAVEKWLRTFPFADEASDPSPRYWDLHFGDIMASSSTPAPDGVDTKLWEALSEAFRGRTPQTGHPWSEAFSNAASAMLRRSNVIHAIAEARARPLTPHDLEIYVRFGWNDHGTEKGLSSLEIGARMSAVKTFWREVSAHVQAEALEALAYERDLEIWKAAADPKLFAADANRYGVSPEQMASDLFPKPSSPPRLRTLLENDAC